MWKKKNPPRTVVGPPPEHHERSQPVYDTMPLVPEARSHRDEKHAPSEDNQAVQAEKQRGGAVDSQIRPLALRLDAPSGPGFPRKSFPDTSVS